MSFFSKVAIAITLVPTFSWALCDACLSNTYNASVNSITNAYSQKNSNLATLNGNYAQFATQIGQSTADLIANFSGDLATLTSTQAVYFLDFSTRFSDTTLKLNQTLTKQASAMELNNKTLVEGLSGISSDYVDAYQRRLHNDYFGKLSQSTFNDLMLNATPVTSVLRENSFRVETEILDAISEGILKERDDNRGSSAATEEQWLMRDVSEFNLVPLLTKSTLSDDEFEYAQNYLYFRFSQLTEFASDSAVVNGAYTEQYWSELALSNAKELLRLSNLVSLIACRAPVIEIDSSNGETLVDSTVTKISICELDSILSSGAVMNPDAAAGLKFGNSTAGLRTTAVLSAMRTRAYYEILKETQSAGINELLELSDSLAAYKVVFQ